MNIDATLFSLASLGILLSTFADAVLDLHVKNRVPGLGFRDSTRTMVDLTKYDAALEYHGLRRRELRARWPPRSPARAWRRSMLATSTESVAIRSPARRTGPPSVRAGCPQRFGPCHCWLKRVGAGRSVTTTGS